VNFLVKTPKKTDLAEIEPWGVLEDIGENEPCGVLDHKSGVEQSGGVTDDKEDQLPSFQHIKGMPPIPRNYCFTSMLMSLEQTMNLLKDITWIHIRVFTSILTKRKEQVFPPMACLRDF